MQKGLRQRLSKPKATNGGPLNFTSLSRAASLGEILPNFERVVPMVPPSGNSLSLFPRSGMSDASTVEPLIYLLVPLIEAVASSKFSKKLGTLTLTILLKVAELVLTGSQQQQHPEQHKGSRWQRGTTDMDGARRSLLDVAGEALVRPVSERAPRHDTLGERALTLGERALQQDTLMRRAKIVVRAMVETSRTEEREGPLLELHRLVERNKNLAEAVVTEGGILPMVEVASRGSMKAKEQAVAVLRRMASLSAEHRVAVSRAGGLAPIVKVIVGGTTAATPQLRSEACTALAWLSKGQPANQSAIADAGTIPALVKLLTSQHDGEPLAAASALCALSAGHEKNCALVVAHGGIALLASLLMPHVFAATRVLPTATNEQALGALHTILLGERGGGQVHVEPDAATAATKALRTVVATLPDQDASFRAELLASLLGVVQDAKGAVAQCSLIALLVLLLETDARDVVQAGAVGLIVEKLGDVSSVSTIVLAAGTILRRLLLTSQGRDAILKHVHKLVVQLKSTNLAALEHALALLDHLSSESDGREAINQAGGAKSLVRLAIPQAIGPIPPELYAIATRILCGLAKDASALPSLVGAGAVQPLVSVLRDGAEDDREQAAAALLQLTSVHGGGPAAADAGIVPLLVSQLVDEGTDRVLRARAISTLCNVARVAESLKSVTSEPRAVAACVQTMRCSTDCREQAATVLATLSEAGRQSDIIAEGGVEALLELLRSGATSALYCSTRALNSVANDASSHAALGADLNVFLELAETNGQQCQSMALAILHKLCTSYDSRVQSLLASSFSLMRWLLDEMVSHELVRQQAAISSLLELCGRPEGLCSLVDCGSLGSLVAAARSAGTPRAKRDALLLLARLATKPHTESLAAAGGTEVFLAAVSSTEADLAMPAAMVLEELVTVPAGYSTILHSGVEPLVELLASRAGDDIKGHVLGVLQYLSATSDGRRILGRLGAPLPLVRLAVGSDPAARSSAMRVLCDLAKESTAVSNLIEAGAIAVIARQLRSAVVDEQEAATAALAQLSGAGGQEAAVRDGALEPLLSLLQGGSVRAQKHAMQTLFHVAQCVQT